MHDATVPPGLAPARCARCGAAFGCGAASAEPCWCGSVRLDALALAEIARRWHGCLCPTCLRTFAAGGEAPRHEAPPAS